MKCIFILSFLLLSLSVNGQSLESEFVNNGGISSNNLSFSVGEIFVIEKKIEEEPEEPLNKAIAYPNPTQNFVIIKTKEPLLSNEIEVYDLSGRLISTQTMIDSKVKLYNLAVGVYLIKSLTEEFESFNILKY